MQIKGKIHVSLDMVWDRNRSESYQFTETPLIQRWAVLDRMNTNISLFPLYSQRNILHGEFSEVPIYQLNSLTLVTISPPSLTPIYSWIHSLGLWPETALVKVPMRFTWLGSINSQFSVSIQLDFPQFTICLFFKFFTRCPEVLWIPVFLVHQPVAPSP